jgi:hypothetical protein
MGSYDTLARTPAKNRMKPSKYQKRALQRSFRPLSVKFSEPTQTFCTITMRE